MRAQGDFFNAEIVAFPFDRRRVEVIRAAKFLDLVQGVYAERGWSRKALTHFDHPLSQETPAGQTILIRYRLHWLKLRLGDLSMICSEASVTLPYLARRDSFQLPR